MSLKSIDRIFGYLQTLPHWEERQRFETVLDCWSTWIEPEVLAQTRPISLVKGVFRVATSNAVWATELNFQRPQILERLNHHLSSPLEDIRFSTAQWRDRQDSHSSGSQRVKQLWQDHPSRFTEKPLVSLERSPSSRDPLEAFENWTRAVKLRSQNLPLCPTCQCPTPPRELERWSVCAPCAAKQWKP